MDEENSTDAEALRDGIGNAAMQVLDTVDDDYPVIAQTFVEHCLLMRKELVERGLEQRHAGQVIIGIVAGAMLSA